MRLRGRMDNTVDRAALLALAEAWMHVARCKFQSAEAELDPMGRRLIEHGATCYFNAARELRALVEAGNVAPNFNLEVLEEDAERP